MSLTSDVSRTRSRFSDPELRGDGREKVSGRAVYTSDIGRKDALWAAFVESPYPHATVRAVDLRAAREIDGVRAVLTAADIDHCRFGRFLCDWPVLASGTVRFIGDRVAAIAAETREAAEQAARLVVVDYAPLPVVADVRAALDPGAPIIHPEWQSYRFLPIGEPKCGERSHPNVYGRRSITKGRSDIEGIFKNASRVFAHAFETPRQHAGYIEPRATLVWIEDGLVHVQTPNKGPFALRQQLAHVIGIPEDRIIIEPSSIGGDFGGKGLTVDELPCYFLALATGRPVRYIAQYSEELRRGNTRHEAVITLRSAIAADGTFLAHHSTVLYNGGAYIAGVPMPWLLPGNSYGAIPYRVPNVRIEMSGVYTNTLPAGHIRGPGEVQTFTSWEVHVDRIARAMTVDPLDFRLKNVVRDGDTTVNGESIDRPMAADILETLRRECGPKPVGRGRGYSLVGAHTGSGRTAVRMRLGADGRIDVVIGVVDQGSGIATVVSRIVSTVLSVDPETVTVRRGSTADALPDPGSGHSRVTHIVGRAALDAAERMKSTIDAARAHPGEPFVSVARRTCAEAEIEVIGTFVNQHGDQVPAEVTFGGYAIDLEVDRETGAVAVREAVFAVEAGQIINPLSFDGQIAGGFVFGFGAAVMEELVLDEDGKVATPSLAEYKLPTIRDIPPLRTIVRPSRGGDGPFGTRMIGELSNVGVPAAVLNAIDDAVGVQLSRFPVRAEDVHHALSAERGCSSSS